MTRSQLKGLLDVSFQRGGKFPSKRLFSRFYQLLTTLRKVQPVESNSDTVWVCPWIRTKGKSPGWYETVVHLYGGKAYVTLDHRYSFSVDLKEKEFEGVFISESQREKDIGDELLEGWFAELKKEI